MKKFIILLSLLIVFALNLSAKTYYYTATHMNSKISGYKLSGWEKIEELSVIINPDTRHIDIYSPEPQVIDYTALKQRKGADFTELSGSATDKNYLPINIYATEYTNGNFYLTIEYSDVRYTYKLSLIEIL